MGPHGTPSPSFGFHLYHDHFSEKGTAGLGKSGGRTAELAAKKEVASWTSGPQPDDNGTSPMCDGTRGTGGARPASSVCPAGLHVAAGFDAEAKTVSLQLWAVPRSVAERDAVGVRPSRRRFQCALCDAMPVGRRRCWLPRNARNAAICSTCETGSASCSLSP